MTRQEVAALLATMAQAWPWARIEPAQAEIWHHSLTTTSPDDAYPTMLDLVATLTKPPSIAEYCAHKRSRAYWRTIHQPPTQLDVPTSERGPDDPAERAAHGQQWIARCRAALHGTPPTNTNNEDDR